MSDTEREVLRAVMNTRAAADYVGLAVQTMARLRVDGTGPRFIKAGRILYRREALDAWLAERERTSTSDVRSMAGAA